MKKFLKAMLVWVVILTAANLLLGVSPSLAEMILVGLATIAVDKVVEGDR